MDRTKNVMEYIEALLDHTQLRLAPSTHTSTSRANFFIIYPHVLPNKHKRVLDGLSCREKIRCWLNPENRFGARHHGAPFLIFQKPSNIFEKKNLRVANDKHYKSANFERKIPCISGTAKKTNTEIFRNMGAYSKLHYSWPDLQFSLFC
jgi:hypothetical protein